jgi:hypothetical protein
MRRYICAECNRNLSKSGPGLGTWTCPEHAERWRTVIKDLSGGKEESLKRREHETPCSVRRHTKVRVVRGS